MAEPQLLYRAQHVLSITHANKEGLEELFWSATKFDNRILIPKKDFIFRPDCRFHINSVLQIKGMPRVFCLLFSSPSTRTQSSFVRAIRNLGGRVDINLSTKMSSMAKGESLSATVKTNAHMGYSGFVIRYQGKEKDALQNAADMCEEEGLRTSIISAGEQNIEHPTQAYLDLYTVWQAKKEQFLNGELVYGVVGDLSDSRTIHSFLVGLSFFGAKSVILISGYFNNLPNWVKKYLKDAGIEIIKTANILEYAADIDVWYFTRYQQEYKKCGFVLKHFDWYYAEKYGATKKMRKLMKLDAIALHPLPHGPEYAKDLDLIDSRFLHYHPQIYNGVLVRMALLKQIYAPHRTFGF